MFFSIDRTVKFEMALIFHSSYRNFRGQKFKQNTILNPFVLQTQIKLLILFAKYFQLIMDIFFSMPSSSRIVNEVNAVNRTLFSLLDLLWSRSRERERERNRAKRPELKNHKKWLKTQSRAEWIIIRIDEKKEMTYPNRHK